MQEARSKRPTLGGFICPESYGMNKEPMAQFREVFVLTIYKLINLSVKLTTADQRLTRERVSSVYSDSLCQLNLFYQIDKKGLRHTVLPVLVNRS